MARPPIDDSAILTETAVQLYRNPRLKFAPAYKQACLSASVDLHSYDSARRRVQRKFKKDRDSWMRAGEKEVLRRREAAFRDTMDRLSSTADAIRSHLNTPEFRQFCANAERAQRHIAQIVKPCLDALSSPVFQQLANNLARHERQAKRYLSSIDRWS